MHPKTSAIAKDPRPSYEAMALVEKFEAFLDYAYPRVQRAPRAHGVVRDHVLGLMAGTVTSLYAAWKSQQVSKLYALDADIAALRFWLRFLAHRQRAIITDKQREEALRRLNEVGSMLGAWIKERKG